MKNLLFALTLAAAAPLAFGGSAPIFESGFETPAVIRRTPKSEGGDVSKQGENPAWLSFQDAPQTAPGEAFQGGTIVAGVTNEIAHSGSQSLFIQAKNLTTPYVGIKLVSRHIQVTPGQVYSVGIWGRNAVRNPITVESQMLYLKMKADFFNGEGSQTGETGYLLVPLPGTLGHKALFVDFEWRRVAKSVTAPPDAQSMTVTWQVDSSLSKRASNGVMFFDDATVIAEPASTPEAAAAPKPASAN